VWKRAFDSISEVAVCLFQSVDKIDWIDNVFLQAIDNNYLFHKKKVKLFFTGFFRVLKTAVLSGVRVGGGYTSDKTAVFSTRTKNKVEKRIYFFIGHELLFHESASAIEEVVETVDDLFLSSNSAKKQ
jgi:hypothetical protein